MLTFPICLAELPPDDPARWRHGLNPGAGHRAPALIHLRSDANPACATALPRNENLWDAENRGHTDYNEVLRA